MITIIGAPIRLGI